MTEYIWTGCGAVVVFMHSLPKRLLILGEMRLFFLIPLASGKQRWRGSDAGCAGGGAANQGLTEQRHGECRHHEITAALALKHDIHMSSAALKTRMCLRPDLLIGTPHAKVAS